MIEAIFLALAPALELWKNEAALRYKKRLAQIQKDYYEESNKADPDHVVLDDLEFKLSVLLRAFGSELSQQTPPTV